MDKESSALRSAQVSNPVSVANGSPCCNINLTPLSCEKSLLNVPQQSAPSLTGQPDPMLQALHFQQPMVDDDVSDFATPSRKCERFEC